MPNRIDIDKEDLVISLYLQEKSLKSVSLETGISLSTVNKILNRRSIKTRAEDKYNIKRMMIGQKIGRLTVLGDDGTRSSTKEIMWKCQCDCDGKIVYVRGWSLRNGGTISCGCFSVETATRLSTTHGLKNAPEYSVWVRMRQRCNNQNDKAYKYYGSRGIKVCKRWEKFENFYKDMGSRPTNNHTIERIDCNGNYEPSNCRWLLNILQNRNRRNVKLIEWEGVKLTIPEWAAIKRIKTAALRYRIDSGWEVGEALNTPLREMKARDEEDGECLLE